MKFYLIANLIFWTILFLMWKRNSFLNFAIKVIAFLMAGWTAFELLKALGYIVKPIGG